MNSALIPAIADLFGKLHNLTPEYHLESAQLVSPGSESIPVTQFISGLTEAGRSRGIFFLSHEPTLPELTEFLNKAQAPVLLIEHTNAGLVPVVLQRQGKKFQVIRYSGTGPEQMVLKSVADIVSGTFLIPNKPEKRTLLVTSQLHQPADPGQLFGNKKPTHIGRLFRLLTLEKQQVWYIYIYAAIAGIISLSLPLGIQSIIGFVSGGQMSTSIVVLILIIVVGLLVVGALQLMQVWLVENLQQRIFSRLAFDFAHRVPRLPLERLPNAHPVELMNRFFETLTLQKGIAKILLEFNAALLQIVFGLVLLALYHPWFILFGLFLAATLALVIKATSFKGIDTSLRESTYKYKLVSWLDSMARGLYTFKLAGHSNLSMQKTDYLTSQYILARRQHFSVLMTQFISFVLFKAVITAGLLILGCILVIRQQINIGQFVAAEIVIILIMNSVEKIILKLDVVYDVLTGLKKITAVTEISLEKSGGINLLPPPDAKGLEIEARNLSFRPPSETQLPLHEVTFHIKPGETICVTGPSDAGKTSLAHVLLALTEGYSGSLAYNGFSFRDLDLASVRNQMAAVIATEQIFEGTLLQNLTCGAPGITTTGLQYAIEATGLADYIKQLPQGLHTQLTGTDWQLPRSVVSRIMLCRCFVQKPKLVVLDNSLLSIDFAEKIPLFRRMQDTLRCTLVIVSHNARIMEFCDRVFYMQKGSLLHQGPYAEIKPLLPVRNLTDTNT